MKNELSDTIRLMPAPRRRGWVVVDRKGRRNPLTRQTPEARWRGMMEAADIYNIRVIRHDKNFRQVEIYDRRKINGKINYVHEIKE